MSIFYLGQIIIKKVKTRETERQRDRETERQRDSISPLINESMEC